jgi:dTDP-4-amino-4,6-dideoxygalactose transaminase
VRAAGIGAGDEVILPANTFIATALAVARAGGTPVLADIDPRYHLVDVEQVARKIGPRTKALLPVHLYGQIAPMEALATLARDKNLILLEDAAQAQGARRNGTGAGGFGLAAGSSFYPGKNLGAYGDAGAVLTNSPEINAKVRALRNYGGEVKYHHPETGFNSRLYVIRVPRRDDVLKKLNAAGIGAGIHYPIPIHLQGAFKQLGQGPGSFPVSETAASEILSLPLFPQITPQQQERVADELRKAIG